MNGTNGPPVVHRLQTAVAPLVARIGGTPAVRTLASVFSTYDRAGGGLVAGGLAYSALLAITAGLLLLTSIIGFVISDPAAIDRIVGAIGEAFPPIEDLARTALEQVAAGAVPSSLVALAGLAFGASAFYTALDDAFARIFRNAPVRNIVERWLRAFLATALVVVLPFLGLVIGVVVSSVLAAAAELGIVPDDLGGLSTLAIPLVTFLVFVGGVAVVFRVVPATHVPWRVLLPPALATGIVVGAFTQLFAIIGPLMLRTAALYGAIVTVFAVLAWLSISFNMLLLGASWTAVRLRALAPPAEHAAPEG